MAIATKARRAWRRLDEAFQPVVPVREAQVPIIGRKVDPDESNWRPINQRSDKDLTPIDHEAMLGRAFYLWALNPMARSIVELKKDYIVGDEITLTAGDDTVLEVLTEHWTDPVNRWDEKVHDKVRELILYGEQCWPAFVAEQSRIVRLGSLDPKNILEVVVDPMNAETPIGVKWKVGQKDYAAKVIVPDVALSPEAQRLRAGYRDGLVFYFAINKLSNATRGLSDLLPVMDVIDILDRLIFNRAEKVEVMSHFFYDVTIAGANAQEIQNYMDSEAGELPRPGAVQAHNERTKWEPMTPRMNAFDFRADFKEIRNYVLGGVGAPPHWFADGGDVNRATALEMGDPSNKRLRSLQAKFEAVLRYVLDFQLEQAIEGGRIPRTADLTYQVVFPELSVRDVEKHAKTLQAATQALVQLTMDGTISQDQARDIVKMIVQPLGVDLDFTDMPDEDAPAAVAGAVVEVYRDAIRRAS